MRYIKREITFLLVLIILTSAFSNLGCKWANAAEKPGTPKISLAHTDNGRGVVIKIAKTTGAKGYYASAIISYDYEDANPDGVSTYSRIIQTTDGDICVRPAMWIKP